MTLVDRLRARLDDARRAYAAYRPEVARYLFEHGFLPTHAALAAQGPPDEALLEALFTLHLETVGTRAFGVSQAHFREDPAYPDLYFARLWLDLVPVALPALAPAQRLPALVALFNLGEQLSLAAPGLGGAVVAHLVEHHARLPIEGVEQAALAALVAVGVLPPNAALVAPTAFTRLVVRATPSVATWDPTFVPAAIAFEHGTLRVWDRLETRSLRLAFAGASVQLLGRDTAPGPAPLPLPLTTRGLSIATDGEVRNEGRPLGRLDPRGLLAVASDGQRVAVTRRFSQRVEVWELAP